MLKIGDNLPHFSCQDDKGNLVTQEDFKGKPRVTKSQNIIQKIYDHLSMN